VRYIYQYRGEVPLCKNSLCSDYSAASVAADLVRESHASIDAAAGMTSTAEKNRRRSRYLEPALLPRSNLTHDNVTRGIRASRYVA
jgi:hypothetical protein